jgi:hypothetical protein
MGFTYHKVSGKIWRKHGQEVEDQQQNVSEEI